MIAKMSLGPNLKATETNRGERKIMTTIPTDAGVCSSGGPPV